MRKSRISQSKQDRLVEHFIAGTTARTAASLVGVLRNSAAFYFHRLREVIAYELEAESEAMFGGEIEVDESYFGGRKKGKRGRGATGKTLYLVYLSVVEKLTHALSQMRLGRRWYPSLNVKLRPTASFIQTAGGATTRLMSARSSTSASIILNSLPRDEITSMASRIFGTKPSFTCANSMVSRESILRYI